MDCPICKRKPLLSSDVDLEMCESCASTMGVMAMPPPRRPPVPCVKCNGMELIRAVPREVSPRVDGTVGQVVSPMGVTFGGQVVNADGEEHERFVAADPYGIYGMLEMYICRKCGFVEWYCSDPDSIPIRPAFMTELVKLGGDGAYR